MEQIKGAAAGQLLPAVQRQAGFFVNFKHSRFPGGQQLAGSVIAIDNVDRLIDLIAAQTRLQPEQVHQVISMAYQSTARFVLQQASAASLHSTMERLGLKLDRIPDVAV